MAGKNLGELVAFKNLVGKTLANCIELFLSSSIRANHSHATLKLKTTIFYFIIRCGIKMVCAFAVSSVVKGHHEYKDVWNAFSDGA